VPTKPSEERAIGVAVYLRLLKAPLCASRTCNIACVGRLAVVTALSTAIGCSSPHAPKPLPTVLVTNAMCDSVTCATLEIRAFLWKFNVPQPPSGFLVLGELPPGRTCITFPPSWSMRVIGPGTAGRVDTTTLTWTPNDHSEIYLIALDSAVFHRAGAASRISQIRSSQFGGVAADTSPYDGLVPGSVGETPNFIPDSAPGWSVAFPSPMWNARLDKAGICES
jgi:hypothetical protein